MKLLTLFFLSLFFHSAGQVQTIKIRKPPHVSICGLDSGLIYVDSIIVDPVLRFTTAKINYKITRYSATIDDDFHHSWWDCKGDKLCPDLLKEILVTDRNKMTRLRVYDIIVIDENKDTIKVNSIGLLLK